MGLWHTVSRVVVTSIWLVIFAFLIYVVHYELTTSRLQADLLSRYAANMDYRLMGGENAKLPFPKTGPYNERLGYVRLPQMINTLKGQGFSVIQQPRWSETLNEFVQFGGFAIYPEKTSAGLTIFDNAGQVLHSSRFPSRTFATFDEIPPLVVQTLLFIENRELLDTKTPYRNPAVEWDRFILAALGQVAQHINPGINFGGGSTLATQIEKFRHSPDGRTGDVSDKLQQMLTASVRAYRQGPLTMRERQRVVLDYLNSTPLTARAGIGEVNGLGDGLWAWFGTDLGDVISLLSKQAANLDEFTRQAEVYKQILSLVLAQRRPSYYLLNNRKALNELTNQHLELLASASIITPALQKVAAALPLRFSDAVQLPTVEDFIAQKAANAVRTSLLRLLDVRSLYELDRIDATVHSTLDTVLQDGVVELLGQINQPEQARAYGLMGEKLLQEQNDLSKLIYSFVLFERTPYGNVVRVQADNLTQPFDLNEGAKLDLGSTAKFRTLATYLEAISEIYERYRAMAAADLPAMAAEANDNLTRWVIEVMRTQPTITLGELQAQAMQRRYSASPNETFFTGGGAHTFVNFEAGDNTKVVTLQEALRMSINLPFIRLMRDLVNYYAGQGPIARRDILGDPDHPARQAYLARYADREGRVFLNRFYRQYHGLPPAEILAKISDNARKTLSAQATIFRSIKPRAPLAEFNAFMQAKASTFRHTTELTPDNLAKLYDAYGIDKYNLADRGYIAGVNPLEIWLATYLIKNPAATREQMLQASVEERQATYSWLFRTVFKGAQDTRIRILLEQDAFARIHDAWARLGYPFERLVPSYATAIGSSADRPGALAELMGIVMNNGRRLPTIRVAEIEFAKGTPYETLMRMTHEQAAGGAIGEQVMRAETAATLKKALADVVDNGTARRLKGVLKNPDGSPVVIGGKTGTGDHRFEVFGSGGRLISSRAVARTATFVFYLGERYFGTITAHVEGEIADNYRFTSGLVTQVLRTILERVINPPTPAADGTIQPATTKPAAALPDSAIEIDDALTDGEEIITLPEGAAAITSPAPTE